MSTGNAPRDEADLEAFLNRNSPLSEDYGNLAQVGPPAAVDAGILAAAKAAARPAAKVPPVAPAAPPAAKPAPPKAVPVRRPEPVPDDDSDDDMDDAVPAARRPRWMVPVALAAGVLVAVGIGFAVLDSEPSAKEEKSGPGSLFAKRARERSEAENAASEAASAEEAEVMVLEAPPPPPPPPVFALEGPQVANLDAAIALIRRELLRADQQEAAVEALPFGAAPEAAAPAATSADTRVDTAVAEPPAAPASGASVIQSRNRRLAKILELYDTENPYLAEDALEIFLRDFADDPISQRILEMKP